MKCVDMLAKLLMEMTERDEYSCIELENPDKNNKSWCKSF